LEEGKFLIIWKSSTSLGRSSSLVSGVFSGLMGGWIGFSFLLLDGVKCLLHLLISGVQIVLLVCQIKVLLICSPLDFGS
jgi:hypothetical protein